MADLYDWADIAAIGVMYRSCPASPVCDLVSRLLLAPKHYCSDIEREHETIAAALREAFEAGKAEWVTRQTLALLDGIKFRGVAIPTNQYPR